MIFAPRSAHHRAPAASAVFGADPLFPATTASRNFPPCGTKHGATMHPCWLVISSGPGSSGPNTFRSTMVTPRYDRTADVVPPSSSPTRTSRPWNASPPEKSASMNRSDAADGNVVAPAADSPSSSTIAAVRRPPERLGLGVCQLNPVGDIRPDGQRVPRVVVVVGADDVEEPAVIGRGDHGMRHIPLLVRNLRGADDVRAAHLLRGQRSPPVRSHGQVFRQRSAMSLGASPSRMSAATCSATSCIRRRAVSMSSATAHTCR
jgi:hypothetical protein